MTAEEATCALTMPDVADGDENGDDVRNGDEEDAGDEAGGAGGSSSRGGMPKAKMGASQAAAVTNVVAGRVGNLLGKGIGGLSSKLGSGGWF
ncbi:calcium-dependent secretion activator-like [Drosophila grimshawi]|uniref:calcium-dependent secretion activator-like n=1 Tax=Drosophila grimshawi TaxID=7222 RepID=UPI001C933A59|nr:calcium-dependent secretion activator-like [Drosophila grimshawi]